MCQTTAMAECSEPRVGTCGCSVGMCRGREAPRCRGCSKWDTNARRVNGLRVWQHSETFVPMPNDVRDVHAYLCKACSVGPGRGSELPHMRDHDFETERVGSLWIADAAARQDAKKKKGARKWKTALRRVPDTLCMFVMDPPKKGDAKRNTGPISAHIRLLTMADVDAERRMHSKSPLEQFFREMQAAVDDSVPNNKFMLDRNVRLKDLEVHAVDSGTRGREFMCVVFVEDEKGEYVVPVAATTFSLDASKSFMDIDMQANATQALRHEVGEIRVTESAKKKQLRSAEMANTQRTMHVDMVYVDPKYGGRGLALKMLVYVEMCTPDDVVYMGFYTKLGNVGMQSAGKNNNMEYNMGRVSKVSATRVLHSLRCAEQCGVDRAVV